MVCIGVGLKSQVVAYGRRHLVRPRATCVIHDHKKALCMLHALVTVLLADWLQIVVLQEQMLQENNSNRLSMNILQYVH